MEYDKDTKSIARSSIVEYTFCKYVNLLIEVIVHSLLCLALLLTCMRLLYFAICYAWSIEKIKLVNS